MGQIAIISEDIIFTKLLETFLKIKIPESLIIHYSSFLEIKEKIDNANFDLILVDGIMAGVASFEIINYLRLSKKIISPIYFFSEVHLDYFKIKAYEIGVNYYYEKPFDHHAVIDDIVTNLVQSNN